MIQKREPRHHGPSWQTILILLGAAALWIGFNMLINTDGGKSGSYFRYAGPVLPLTAVSGGKELEVQRHVDFDFSTYEHFVPSPIADGEILVTDTYQLTNPSEKPLTLQLAYPYEGQLKEEGRYIPAITVEGREPEVKTYSLTNEAWETDGINDFEEYKAWMTAADQLALAMEDAPEADIPVKVYHFTDITYHGDTGYPYIFLTVDFTIPEGASVWVLHFDVLQSEDNRHSLWFQEDLDERDGAYLFVMNGDVENMTFGGNLGHNVTPTSALTDVTCDCEVYESSFADLVWQFAKGYDYSALYDEPEPELLTPELLYRDSMKRMADQLQRSYDGISGTVVSVVEDAFYHALKESRLLYRVFPVEIPAGASVTVEVKYRQQPSIDVGGPKKAREGYDMATRLGSTLPFTAQSAGITGSEFVEILRQNFGFRPERGITQVDLDLEEERYYLDVAVKSK